MTIVLHQLSMDAANIKHHFSLYQFSLLINFVSFFLIVILMTSVGQSCGLDSTAFWIPEGLFSSIAETSEVLTKSHK